jgi:Rrf2 family protein
MTLEVMKLEIMRRTDIALQALRLLEREGGLIQAADLATGVGSTAQFIPQILTPLVRTGWITSEPGPRGGYSLATDLGRRTVLELIELIEGPTDNGRCVLEGTDCSPGSPCSLHDAWTWARAALIERLGATPISPQATTVARKASK